MKKRLRVKRTFVGHGTCLGAVSWSVAVRPHFDKKKHPGKMDWDGELCISDDAQCHWVDNQKDMVPLYKMQRQLNIFILECEKAMLDVGQHNEQA